MRALLCGFTVQPCRVTPERNPPRGPATPHRRATRHATRRGALPRDAGARPAAGPCRAAPPCDPPRGPAVRHSMRGVTLDLGRERRGAGEPRLPGAWRHPSPPGSEAPPCDAAAPSLSSPLRGCNLLTLALPYAVAASSRSPSPRRLTPKVKYSM